MESKVRAIGRILTGHWASGAIFGKELRVASRQKRYYCIRLIYIVALLAILLMAWADLSKRYSVLNMTVYLTEAVGQICRMIAILQFFAAQAAAVFLLSGVIAEEVRRRTLGVLLTTPITSFQIVGGKLFSKLLQVWMLLCLSLPIFAILRVYSGIPWEFLIQTTAVTLAAVFFVAAVTLMVGTFFRRSYSTLIVSVIIIVLYYSSWSFQPVQNPFGANGFVYSFNPFHAFCMTIGGFQYSFPARSGGSGFVLYYTVNDPLEFSIIWGSLIQCGLIVILSLLLLAAAAWRVRKIALKELTRDKRICQRKLLSACELVINWLPRISRRRRLRTVRGQVMVWKEMHNSLIRGELLRGRYLYLLLIGAIVITYSLFLLAAMSDVEWVLSMTIICLAAAAALVTINTAAASVTKEKETASWQVLLCTPLSDGQILWGKIVGVFRRSAVAWGVLLLLLTILSYVGICRYWAVLMTAVVAFGITVFLAGTGVYLSVRSSSTPRAVMIILFIAAILWVVPPMLWQMIPGAYSDVWDGIAAMHPLAHIFRVMEDIEPPDYFDPYLYFSGPFDWLEDFMESDFFIVFNALCYVAVGAVFAWRAKVIVRRKIC